MTVIIYFLSILIVNASVYTPQYKNILQYNLYCLYFTIIIIELHPPSNTEIYTTFQNLYIALNIRISKKGYALLQNVLRNVKKGNYKKYKYNVIRGVYLKPNNLEKRK